MVPDALVEFWLGNGRIVHFAMAVAAVADDVDNHVAAELRAVFRGHSPGAHDGIGISAVHVANGHGLPPGDVGSEARGMLLVRRRCEADAVVPDGAAPGAHGVSR